MSGVIEYGRFKIAVVPVKKLVLLEKNARYMKSETFRQLVENIKADGQLSQIPFCLQQGTPPDEIYLVLSGNHRAKAAIAAELTEIPIIYTDEALTREKQVAIQLSHNALAGEDDPVVLRELWLELQSVSEKLYAGLDDKALKLLSKIDLPPLADVRLDFRSVTFLFLPEETGRLKELLTAGLAMVQSEDVYLARLESFDKLLDALAKTQSAYKVSNAATSLLCFLELYARNMIALEDGWYDPARDAHKHSGMAPYVSLFGGEAMPADAAVVVRRAIDRMIKAEDCDPKKRWQAVERLAADYLAGPDGPQDPLPSGAELTREDFIKQEARIAELEAQLTNLRAQVPKKQSVH